MEMQHKHLQALREWSLSYKQILPRAIGEMTRPDLSAREAAILYQQIEQLMINANVVVADVYRSNTDNDMLYIAQIIEDMYVSLAIAAEMRLRKLHGK